MKRGTIGHAKVANLARMLGLERWGAVGLLESLWHATVQYRPRGDIGRSSNADIAFYVGWTGDPDKLVNAMLEAGWLDASSEHRLVIHDWYVHADDSVHMSLARATEYFASGETPKMTRLGGTEKAGCEAKYARRTHGVHTESTRNTHGVHTASPRPAPPSPPPPRPRVIPPAADVEIPQALKNAPGFIEAWRDWKDSRSKKYKPQGEKSQLTRLVGMGPERAVAAIRYSLAQGWQGIFEEKTNGQNGTSNGWGGKLARPSSSDLAAQRRAQQRGRDCPEPPSPIPYA